MRPIRNSIQCHRPAPLIFDMPKKCDLSDHLDRAERDDSRRRLRAGRRQFNFAPVINYLSNHRHRHLPLNLRRDH